MYNDKTKPCLSSKKLLVSSLQHMAFSYFVCLKNIQCLTYDTCQTPTSLPLLDSSDSTQSCSHWVRVAQGSS